MLRILHLVLGFIAAPPRRDERGLSQSTENVMLLTGALIVAGLVVTAVVNFIHGSLSLTLPAMR